MPLITVFTPTFNRRHTLQRLYLSLCQQTSSDFKWLIIDDGSQDGTNSLVNQWLQDKTIDIEYYWKPNGGMHTAHNEAYMHIDTELAVCIDSDDWMPENAVQRIIELWKQFAEGKDTIAGIIGLDTFEDGQVVGTSFPETLHSCKVYDLERKYGVVRDKKYVFKTEVIKKYLPYPEYKGERYGGVNMIYSQMSVKYDFLCFNEVFCIVEYQEDGLTNMIFKQYINSPRTQGWERVIAIKSIPYLRDKIRNTIHLVSCSIFAHDFSLLWMSPYRLLTIIMIPMGIMLNLYVRYINHKTGGVVKNKYLDELGK